MISTPVTSSTRYFMPATSWSTFSRFRRRSSTPSTFISGGMRVALRLAAGGLVVDLGRHREAAAAVAAAKDADARRQVGMVGFGQRLDGVGAVFGVGGEHHLPGAVEHADAVDALLERDGLHHLVGGLAMVVEHGVPGRAGDALGELVRAEDHRVQELLLLGFYVHQPGNRRHDDHDDGDREHQLPRKTSRHIKT